MVIQIMDEFLFSIPMEVAEIKVSYSNTNPNRVQVTNSQRCLVSDCKHWDLDIFSIRNK